ncbi:ubiquitin carboxyl-terminal hydrolase 44-B-like [Oscarella lobularis]|uniref:ubiquitin carboxyl-terminal hydrolase 44-B-like n=1 Tax=Oscarella lobularis TaxID=121494 RepID=UPI003313687D
MSEECRHVLCARNVLSISRTNKGLFRPSNWSCSVCGTTESVWACLSCSHFGCGRYAKKHALDHFNRTNHPLALEINRLYVFCYECDSYVFNDNKQGDIKLVRDTVSQVATRKFEASTTRSGRILRRQATIIEETKNDDEENDKNVDKMSTAICHHRVRLLSIFLSSWRRLVQSQKVSKVKSSTKHFNSSTQSKIKCLAPGITGLRNLGNTCYMNSALQALSHQPFFRECFRFLALSKRTPQSPAASIVAQQQRRKYVRQTTVDCYEEVMTAPAMSFSRKRKFPVDHHLQLISSSKRQFHDHEETTTTDGGDNNDLKIRPLCKALHALFRVMWSGKWSMVTPRSMLNAVWGKLPDFHGYSQQDAQEFLCEFLSEVHCELTSLRDPLSISGPVQDSLLPCDVIPRSFEGKLISQVTCLTCENVSQTVEPFLDLSLEFPARYQIERGRANVSTDECPLSEMLNLFTEREMLGSVYSCSHCSQDEYQPATKQLKVKQLPDVLRLHLKRFRWCGKRREKISVHVPFPIDLDMEPYVCNENELLQPTQVLYRLTGVIMHHGRGFISGHYTSYCWNPEAETWVDCNDSRMSLCSVDDVLKSQAYVLFYTRHGSTADLVRHIKASLTSPSLTPQPTSAAAAAAIRTRSPLAFN